MKLIDFQEHSGMNRLRQCMNAEAGHFELFDPSKHSSLEQRARMSSFEGLTVTGVQLAESKKRLEFLDCKVLAQDESKVLHFTRCSLLKQFSYQEVTLFIQWKHSECPPKLCPDCLEAWQQHQSGRRRQRQPGLQASWDSQDFLKTLSLGRIKLGSF